jgi:hypothetical protein
MQLHSNRDLAVPEREGVQVKIQVRLCRARIVRLRRIHPDSPRTKPAFDLGLERCSGQPAGFEFRLKVLDDHFDPRQTA